MFRSAYFRLMVWYVAILMALSLAFSAWVYREAMQEVRSGLNGPVIVHFQDRLGPITRGELQRLLEQQFSGTQGRLFLNLLLLNLGVLAIGSAASYALARRTMRPIELALESQNRFAADASHELRTPLSAMKTEIEVALRDPNLSKSEMRELLRSNLEETDRMSGLAEALLTLARSGGTLDVQSVSADEMTKEVCNHLRPLADAKKITLKQEFGGPNVMAEHKTAATILSILLENAIKYSPNNSEITLVTTRKDGLGCISVIDNGPGIAASDLEHIFERFYRSDNSRAKVNVAGHGLGLSIAQKLTVALKGTIVAKSTLNKGSTFTLRLPIAGN